jgi:hypothetical protein
LTGEGDNRPKFVDIYKQQQHSKMQTRDLKYANNLKYQKAHVKELKHSSGFWDPRIAMILQRKRAIKR